MSSQYTESQRLEAIRAFVVAGTYKSAAAVVGIPWQTIASWKHADPQWWDQKVCEVSLKLLEGLTEASQHKALTLRERLLELISDRLEHGEFKLNVKTGEVVRVPASLADMTKTFQALGGQKVEPKPAAEMSEEDRIAEFARLAEEDRASRAN